MNVRALTLLALLLWGGSLLQAVEFVALDPARGRPHELEMREAGGGVLELVMSGGDPFLVLDTGAEVARDACVLVFEYFCPDGIDALQVFFGPPIREENSVRAGRLASAEVWQPVAVDLAASPQFRGAVRQLRIDFGTKSGVRLQLRGMQLRAPSPEEQARKDSAAQEVERKRAEAALAEGYRSRQWPSVVDAVRLEAASVLVRGEVGGGGEDGVFLCEVQPHEQPWKMTQFSAVAPLSRGRFELALPRRVDGRDRICSRWCVARRVDGAWCLDSAAKYALEFPGLDAAPFPKWEPRTKKGMGGLGGPAPLEELVELGVEHVTVNVVLTQLLRMRPDAGAPVFEFEGHQYGAVTRALESLDRTVKFCSDHAMGVSAILLVGFPREAELRGAMVHPEACEPGIYAMPNLTTVEGVRAYRAVLALLARRYCSVEHGFIRRWIVHNEVDYGWTWTNMGEQPAALYMDHYVRSLRLVWLAARERNPEAEVFISLTHGWIPPRGDGTREYGVRGLLERLADASSREGDFGWGVAYHPYPQSLFDPRAWNDRRVAWSFDTELVTPRNIEVLDAFMHEGRMRTASGGVRSVMLSEQGFHTAGYGEEAQRLQAAALAYTWHKIRPLRSIVAFQYHRWVDAADEGGLLLGLRTLASPGKPFGEKKRAWSVFKALDTDVEGEATAFALPVIGVDAFDAVPYRGSIR